MKPLQATKLVNVTPPAAIRDNSSFPTASVDTKGFRYCTFVVILGATDIAFTAFKVQESNDDGSADAYADVTGGVFGTSVDIAGAASALPSATDDNKIYLIEVDCRGRERYLDLVLTIGDGSTGGFATVLAILSDAEIAPVTAAERGCGQILRVP